MALIHRLDLQHKVYLTIIVFSAISPIDDIILALGGIIIVLAALLIILKSFRKKKSQEKLDKRVSGIKNQFDDIKDESTDYEEDDWLETRLKENSDNYERQLGMNKK